MLKRAPTADTEMGAARDHALRAGLNTSTAPLVMFGGGCGYDGT